MLLELNPIAFAIGDFLTVRWYGIILGLGALAGLFLAVQEGKRFGIKSDFFLDLLLIGVPSAIIGARAYYVAFSWDSYKHNLIDIFKIWEGGIAIYGALIGAMIGAFFYVRAKGYRFWRIADICAPGLIIGQMIGRWGNFMNQEAHGGPVSEEFLRNTLNLPNFIVEQMYINGTYYHPAFLYESLWNLVGLLLLFVLRRRAFLRAGELFMTYIMWYSLGRFFIEGVRTDSLAFNGPSWLVSLMDIIWTPMTLIFEPGAMAYGNVRISQLLAILLIVAGIIFIIYRRKTGKAEERYSDPIVSTKEPASESDSTTSSKKPVNQPVIEPAAKQEDKE